MSDHFWELLWSNLPAAINRTEATVINVKYVRPDGWSDDMWLSWLKIRRGNRGLYNRVTKALVDCLEESFWGDAPVDSCGTLMELSFLSREVLTDE